MKGKVEVSEQRMLPHDTDTECAVLSAFIMYNDKFLKYDDVVDVDLFYYEKEKAIFRCISGVIKDGGRTDVNALYAYTQSHDVGYGLFRGDFANVFTNTSRVTLDQDIARLRDMADRRKLYYFLYKASQDVLDMTSDVDAIMTNVLAFMSEFRSDMGNGGVISNDETFESVKKTVEENRTCRGRSLKTGFSLFDDRHVLRPGTMTVIAAFTSVGKSTLAMNITQSVAMSGGACAYYSLEMSSTELVSRMLSKDADLSASAIMNRRLDDDQVKRVYGAMDKIRGLPIYYDDRSTVDFERTLRSIRRMVQTKGIKLAVIDYLQIYGQVKEDVEESISYMARAVKNLANELGIAIILISQLNRNGLHPAIKMLRGSGQIEESADNVVLIDRPEAYPDNKVTKYEGEFKNVSVKGTAKLILSKGRGIGTGAQLVGFDAKHVRFFDIEKPEDAGNHEEQDEALPF